mmetsp:Transcript_1307/g.1645  ORF Transcript_1307/g.1645 Transcript_1307/m.1645 type:complete len:138 (+) Transcript_1307:1713-2126(+)
MSYTSDENNDEQALLDLIKGSSQVGEEKKQQPKKKGQSPKKEEKKSSKSPSKAEAKTSAPVEQPNKKGKKEKIDVKFDSQDLGSHFNTKQKKVLTTGEEGGTDFQKLFVTEDDNEVMQQFEKEKQAEIEHDLGTKVP